LLKQLYPLARDGFPIQPADIDQSVRALARNPEAKLKDFLRETIVLSPNKKPITPKSVRQKQYLEEIRTNDIVFGIGPAGTGKTYLAMAMAVAALHRKEIRRLILARPAVEAGEKLGFLPGDLYEKVNPYLRPLYDALEDMMTFNRLRKYLDGDMIEIIPLAYMRGRTLNEGFIILDEAQNTTVGQMKMFLTRMGFHSKTVITGDITQIDLPGGQRSGLVEALEILDGAEGFAFIRFTHRDVVRHRLVQEVVDRYDQWEARQSEEREPR
jgi:phosphate starvation-inducible PhoH-like protein